TLTNGDSSSKFSATLQISKAMSKYRPFPFNESQAGVFHVVSRIVGREFRIDGDGKDFFVRVMRGYEELLGLEVLTWCVMSNHFHMLVRVPHRPEGDGPDVQTLLDRMKRAVGQEQFKLTVSELDMWARAGNESAIEDWRQRQIERMYSLSEFMRCVKLRFTRWYNRRMDRKGVLWESRYTSVIVQDEERALKTMATYIDLNPVRAGVVEDPADYGWSGYAEAMRGERKAQEALVKVAGRAAWKGVDASESDGGPAWSEWDEVPAKVRRRALLIYRGLLGFAGRERRSEDGKVIRRGLSEAVQAKLASEGERKLAVELAGRRVRHFTAGVIVGSRKFIDGWFADHRDWFRGASATDRKTGARSMGRRELRGLYSLRTLRE